MPDRCLGDSYLFRGCNIGVFPSDNRAIFGCASRYFASFLLLFHDFILLLLGVLFALSLNEQLS